MTCLLCKVFCRFAALSSCSRRTSVCMESQGLLCRSSKGLGFRICKFQSSGCAGFHFMKAQL